MKKTRKQKQKLTNLEDISEDISAAEVATRGDDKKSVFDFHVMTFSLASSDFDSSHTFTAAIVMSAAQEKKTSASTIKMLFLLFHVTH